jgi:hypothetical protein
MVKVVMISVLLSAIAVAVSSKLQRLQKALVMRTKHSLDLLLQGKQHVYDGSVDKSFGLDMIGEQHLEHAATLLQCDIDELSNALMYKTVSVEQKAQGSSSSTSYTSSRRSKQRSSSKRSEHDVAFTVPATEKEAWCLKDMLCKQLYTIAFEWMLQQHNAELLQATNCLRFNENSIYIYIVCALCSS